MCSLLYFILIFRITALAYTTLDGLLAVFLYNISYIVKAWDYEWHWNSRKLAVSKSWQYQQSHSRFLILEIMLPDILDLKKR